MERKRSGRYSSDAGISTTPSERLIILGAGKPFDGERHTALRGAGSGKGGGELVIDWLLRAFEPVGPEIHFVGGYRVENVLERYPDLSYSINAEWSETGPADSLLKSDINPDTPHWISYADVLFRSTLIESLSERNVDIVVAVDSQWRSRYHGRSQDDIARCEKVTVSGDRVTRLGADIDPEVADAEFLGVCRLSASTCNRLLKERNRFPDAVRTEKLSYLLELLRARGFDVRAVDVHGDWAELNDPHDIAHFVFGTKAQTLDRLQQLVRLSEIQDQVSFTVETWNGERDTILRQIRGKLGGSSLVVRSSALSEDGFSTANAGAYTSVLDVDRSDDSAIAHAVETVIASYPDGNAENQVLVQPMVNRVKASGVLFTRTLSHGAPYYVVNYDDISTSTESITSGASEDHKTFVIHRSAGDSTHRLPEVIRPVLPAVREIESLLDFDALDIEFAVDQEDRVHILQVRPIAVSHGDYDTSDDAVATKLSEAQERFHSLQHGGPFIAGSRAAFGIMPDWNPAEIIGTTPGQLAISLYRYLIMDDVWARQRAEYGYRDVRPAPLLVILAGHPYVDIRASLNSFIPKNVPDSLAGRLVDFYLNRLELHPEYHDKIEFEIVPTCYGLNFGKWRDLLKNEGAFTESEIETLEKSLHTLTAAAIERGESDLEPIELLAHRTNLIAESGLPALERAMCLLEDCRRYGTVAFSHLARSAFVSVTLLTTAVESGVISEGARDDFLATIRTVSHEFTEDAAAVAQGINQYSEFSRKYGHLRPGTYDITSPSYSDDPQRYLDPIIAAARESVERRSAAGSNVETGTRSDESEAPRSIERRESVGTAWEKERSAFASAVRNIALTDDFDRLEDFMRISIEGREHSKFVFTRTLSKALDAIAEYGNGLELSRDQISHIPLHIFMAIRSGAIAALDAGSWLTQCAESGATARTTATHVELPPLIFSKNDLFGFSYPGNAPNFIGRGRVSGDVVDLAAHRANDRPDIEAKIVLIPQADPGYDWLFGQNIAGLVTTYGGANSHMAIRAAEFGLPAAIGVGDPEYRRLAAARALELDAGNRQIKVIR